MCSNAPGLGKRKSLAERFALRYYEDTARYNQVQSDKCLQRLERLEKDMDNLRKNCKEIASDYCRLQERCTQLKRGNLELKMAVARRNEEMKDVLYLDKLIDHLKDVGDKMKLVPVVVDADADEEVS